MIQHFLLSDNGLKQGLNEINSVYLSEERGFLLNISVSFECLSISIKTGTKVLEEPDVLIL